MPNINVFCEENRNGGLLGTSATGIGYLSRWDLRRSSTGQYGALIWDDVVKGTWTSTTPTTTNGNFNANNTDGAQQGWITEPFTRSIPAGNWTFEIDIFCDRNTGHDGRFVAFFFKAPSNASSMSSSTCTAITMYDPTSTTTAFTGPAPGLTGTNIGTTIQSGDIEWYSNRILLENERLFVQIWWEIIQRTSDSGDLRIDPSRWTNPPRLISPDFKRKRFVIS